MQVIYTLEQAKEILKLLSVGNIDKLSVSEDSGVYVINYEVNEDLKQISPKVYSVFSDFVKHMEQGDVEFFSLKFVYNKEYSCSQAYTQTKEDVSDEITYTSSELKQLLIDQLTKEGKIDESVEVYNKVQGNGKQKRYIKMTVKEVLERI